jgi:alanine dehydrogenase
LRLIDAADVDARLPYGPLVDALEDAFRIGGEVPVRHHHPFARPDGPNGTLLLMPAWQVGGSIGVKIATIAEDNVHRGLPSVMATYLLLDATTGQPRAVMDGTSLTLRRTACASALAARFLAREDSRRLVMVGAGALAPHLVRAHATVRPIREVVLWNRHPARAEALVPALAGDGLQVTVTDDLEAAVRLADVVSSATMAVEPLIRGAWLREGAHLDLVGAYRPSMRESDDDAVRVAEIFVDSRAGALAEAGDIVLPLRAGVIGEGAILADLFDLCRGGHPGRTSAEAITLFKSVGHALEDLAAAQLVAGTG